MRDGGRNDRGELDQQLAKRASPAEEEAGWISPVKTGRPAFVLVIKAAKAASSQEAATAISELVIAGGSAPENLSGPPFR